MPFPRRVVKNFLKVGKELWSALRFVENGTFRKTCQKPPRVFESEAQCVGIFKRHVWLFVEQSFYQCSFSRLTRSDDSNRFEICAQLFKFFSSVANDHPQIYGIKWNRI